MNLRILSKTLVLTVLGTPLLALFSVSTEQQVPRCCLWARDVYGQGWNHLVRKAVNCHSKTFSFATRLSTSTPLLLFIGFELCKCIFEPLNFVCLVFEEGIGQKPTFSWLFATARVPPRKAMCTSTKERPCEFHDAPIPCYLLFLLQAGSLSWRES